MIGENV